MNGLLCVNAVDIKMATHNFILQQLYHIEIGLKIRFVIRQKTHVTTCFHATQNHQKFVKKSTLFRQIKNREYRSSKPL